MDCPADMLFNDLICECLTDPSMIACDVACDAGLYPDPLYPCECVDETKLVELFPSWASTYDVLKSVNYDFSTSTDATIMPVEEDWVVCPWEEHTRDCLGVGLYWNELVCACLYFDQCDKTCDAGYELDPRYPCTCEYSQNIRYEFFTSDMTDEQVANSTISGIDNFIAASESHWYLPCPADVEPVCEDPNMFWNELVCGCVVDHAMYQCDTECDGY